MCIPRRELRGTPRCCFPGSEVRWDPTGLTCRVGVVTVSDNGVLSVKSYFESMKRE